MSGFEDKIEFYCLSYQNPERAKDMTDRFAKIGAKLNIYGGVAHDDARIAEHIKEDKDAVYKRVWSVTYGHLDMLQLFYETGKPYGMFCEDDIYIRSDLGKRLPEIIQDFDYMNLELMLMGYMTTSGVSVNNSGYNYAFPFSETRGHQYHRYPNEQWGTHLYMVSREYAKTAVEKFGKDHAPKTLTNNTVIPFNPDWTITKPTRRALIYPMMGLENGKDSFEHYGHWGQYYFHMDTFKTNYIEGEFV